MATPDLPGPFSDLLYSPQTPFDELVDYRGILPIETSSGHSRLPIATSNPPTIQGAQLQSTGITVDHYFHTAFVDVPVLDESGKRTLPKGSIIQSQEIEFECKWITTTRNTRGRLTHSQLNIQYQTFDLEEASACLEEQMNPGEQAVDSGFTDKVLVLTTSRETPHFEHIRIVVQSFLLSPRSIGAPIDEDIHIRKCLLQSRFYELTLNRPLQDEALTASLGAPFTYFSRNHVFENRELEINFNSVPLSQLPAAHE